MAEVKIYNSTASPVLALDMNQISISAWLDLDFASLRYYRPYQYWIADWLTDGSLFSTRIFGYNLEYSNNGPTNGEVWGLQHSGPGFQMDIYYFDFLGTDGFLDLIRSDNRKEFWATVLSDDDEISGTALNDRVFGWGGNDSITTAEGKDTIVGGQGNDSLAGGRGADIINGGNGDDRISGGLGRDRLTGGQGADSFVFSSSGGGANRDRITDFDPDEDLIVLSRSTFSLNGSPGQALQEANFHTGASATADTHRIIYDPSTGNLIFDRDGSGALPSSVFASLAPGLVIDAGSFVLTD